MKKSVFGLVILMVAASANAFVLNFEDLPVNSSYYDSLSNANGGSSSYGGLTWSGSTYVMDVSKPDVANSGYANGATSGVKVLFNGAGASLTVSSGTTFDWNGGFFTGAWNDGLQVHAVGSANGVNLYDATLAVNTSGPTWFNANFSGIDTLTFSSYGGTPNTSLNGGGTQFTMDDMSFNQTANVPEPTALSLLAIGLSALGLVRRRKAPR